MLKSVCQKQTVWGKNKTRKMFLWKYFPPVFTNFNFQMEYNTFNQGRPGVLRFMGLQRVGHGWTTELNWTVVTPPYSSILQRCREHFSRTAVPCCALFFGVMNYSWQICSRFGLLQPFPDLRRIVLNTLMSLYLLLRVGFILSYVL